METGDRLTTQTGTFLFAIASRPDVAHAAFCPIGIAGFFSGSKAAEAHR